MNSSSKDKPIRKTYDGHFNLSLLCEELYEAFPEWTAGGTGFGKVIASPTGVKLIFPTATNISEVDSIMAAHDPTKDSKNQKQKKDKRKLRKDAKQKLRDLGLTAAEVESLIGPDEV